MTRTIIGVTALFLASFSATFLAFRPEVAEACHNPWDCYATSEKCAINNLSCVSGSTTCKMTAPDTCREGI